MSSSRQIRILQIGDLQKGFTVKTGNLYVKGATDILIPAEEFLKKINRTTFDYIFIILDTHFSEEYALSEEARNFPLHCEYNTDDWELAIDIPDLPERWYLMKNQFSMWGDKKKHEVFFIDPDRKTAYECLFHFVDDPSHPRKTIRRDSFISSVAPMHNPANIDVTLFGVASDFCNRFAMEGWLARGSRVTILEDLTRGIQNETSSVLEEYQYQSYIPDRLRAISWHEFLKEVNIQ